MSAPSNPREGGRGVECQERKRHGGSRTFQALKEVQSFRSNSSERRPRSCAAFRLWRYAARACPRRFPQSHRQIGSV